MQNDRLVPAVVLALASLGSAQHSTTDALRAERHVPARPGAEGPKRYDTSGAIDWTTARVPELPPDQPLPEGFVPLSVGFDPATGLESYDALPVPAGPGQGWVTGNAPRDQVPEWLEALGSPSAVTSTAFPWSTQCRIFFTQTGGNFVCSGTLVDAKTLLTAGHCVHEGGGGNWSTAVTVSPAWDGDDGGFGSANYTSLHSYTGWTVSGNYDWDMGYIRLDRPLGFLTGWLGYGYDNNDSFFSGSTFNFAAYPGCGSGCFCSFAGCPNQLYYGFGTFDSVSTYRLTANLTSWCFTGGMSGGGIYFLDGASNRYVYGANSTRSTSGCTIVSNTWTRMTQTEFDDLQLSVIPGGYPVSLDLVPLDVNASGSVSAGARLSFLDYLVANSSLSDPASAAYDADFYLSTNDNISTADTLLQTRSFTWNFAAKSSVRITSSSNLPQIPAGTLPGAYWLGLILDVVDADVNNNDTDGWDAVPITVNRTFPNLPASFLSVGSSGAVLSFDSTFPSYFASNRLDSETLLFNASAWVNYGNLAACLAPFRGSCSLELGNNPAGGAVTPDTVAALIVGLNGLNGTTFEMDFMLADHGEETSTWDGLWLSQDGNAWYSLTPLGWAPLSPLGIGEWYSVRDVPLTGATPVNTDNNFYLAFIAQDNFPFAGADGIGIDDVRIRRTDAFTISISNPVSGAVTQLHLSGGTPGSLGCSSYSTFGGGPINLPFGTLLLTPPFTSFPCFVLNAAGGHTLNQLVPPGLTGTHVWFQSLEWPSFEFTNGVDLFIK